MYAVCRLIDDLHNHDVEGVFAPAIERYLSPDQYTVVTSIDPFFHDDAWVLVEILPEHAPAVRPQVSRSDNDIWVLLGPSARSTFDNYHALQTRFGIHLGRTFDTEGEWVAALILKAANAEAAALDDPNPFRALTAESSSSSSESSASSSSSDARLETISTLLSAIVSGVFLGVAENYGQARFDFRLAYEKRFTNGTGSYQVNKTYVQSVPVPARSAVILDLTALVSTLYGHQETISLALVKKLVIQNVNTAAADKVYIKPYTADKPWNPAFQQHNPSRIEIPGGSILVLSHATSGWAVNPASERNLLIQNPTNNSVNLRVEITGVAA